MQTLSNYLPLYGKWSREDDKIIFTSSDNDLGHGLALFGYDLEDGTVEVEIKLEGNITKCGAMIVFRANGQELFYAAGIGGWESTYSLNEGNNQLYLKRITGVGCGSNIEHERTYKVKIVLEGQKVDIFIDHVKVISYSNLPRQTGTSVGLFCLKETPKATFCNFRVSSSKPKAFVAMQFSEPYNDVYRDAVEPLVKEIGFEPLRVDDVYGPRIVINDIINNLSESSIVLAEISEKNANVYYELGLAHAFGKPTLLMATKGTSLPFDVGAHRCIFYENTIAGRCKLQASLKHSLMSLLGRSIQS
ncbi:MAG: hypothetical protein WCI11_20090 [Candidatus Methylumidiphilus sp.]